MKREEIKEDVVESIEIEEAIKENEVRKATFGDTFCFLGVVVSIVGLIFSVLESIFHAIEVVGPVYVFVATASQICLKVGLVSILIYLLFVKENK